MTIKYSVRNDERVLLVGFCIWYTLEDSGKWVGQEKGGDELHCEDSAPLNARRQQMEISHTHQSTPLLLSLHIGRLFCH